VGDPPGDGGGLSRSGSGQDAHRSAYGSDSLALLGIQPVEYRVPIHPMTLPFRTDGEEQPAPCRRPDLA